MKKTRRIKMVVTTREVLAVRQNAHDDVSAYSDLQVCPLCCSPLAHPLQISAGIQSPTALLLAANEGESETEAAADEHLCQQIEMEKD